MTTIATTTLAAGSSVTVTLDYTDKLSVDGKGTATFTSTTGANTSSNIDGATTFQPFGALTTVVLKAAPNKALIYAVADNAPGASLATDASGNAVGVAGVGGSTIPFGAALGGVTQVALLGDSMTALAGGNSTIASAIRSNNVVTVVSPSVNPNTGDIFRIYNMLDTSFNVNSVAVTRVDVNTLTYPSVGADGSTTNLTVLSLMQAQRAATGNNNSYFFWLNAKTGGAFRAAINAGNNGNTSVQMLARVSADVLPYNPQAVIIFCGANDFLLAVPQLTAAQVFANVTAMIAQCVGKLVIVVSALPWAVLGTNTNRSEAAKYNRMIRAYCNSNPRCRFADAARYLVDFNNATRFSPLTGMLRTDGIHPTPKGAERIAQAIIDATQYDLPRPSRLVNNQADTYGFDPTNSNILDSAPFTNTGGGVTGGATGTAAAQLAVTLTNTSTLGALVGSCPARADGIGYDQQAVFTSGGNNDALVYSIGTGYITGRFNVGDKIQLLAELSLSGLAGANLKGFSCTIGLQGIAGAAPTIAADQGENALAAQMVIDGVYTLVSPEITLPSGCTGITANIVFTASAAGTALTTKLGRISIEKV